MEIIDGVKILEVGDVVTIKGKRYYCEQNQYLSGCGICSFRNMGQCYKWQEKEGIDGCAKNKFHFVTVNNVIKREKKKIRESQKLINKLSK